MRRHAVLSIVLIAGCPAREVAEIDPNQQPEVVKDIQVEVIRDIDILFVIDNSGSMGEEQASLVSNFPRFTDVLENIEGGLPNVHIGVVSTNVGVGGYQITGCGGDGDDGRLLNQARTACTPPSGYYISNIAGVTNYTGTLAESFSCIARLGIDGCGFEQQFEAMKRALDGSNPQNQGFLRPEALLAVIFVTDEDDCSAKDTAIFDPAQTAVTDPLGPLSSFRCTEFGIECGNPRMPITRTPATYENCGPRTDSPYIQHPDVYVDFLKSLKPDPRMIVVAGISGNPTPVVVSVDAMGKPVLEPSCVSGAGEAAPGVRMSYFYEQFPDRNTFVSICNDDLSDALQQVAELLALALGDPCLDGDLDVTDLHPDAPGIQIDCAVTDTRFPGEANQTAVPIRRCTMQNDSDPVAEQDMPCWYVKLDTATCPRTQDYPPGTPNTPARTYDTGLILTILRAPGQEPPVGTHLIARCAVNPS